MSQVREKEGINEELKEWSTFMSKFTEKKHTRLRIYGLLCLKKQRRRNLKDVAKTHV